MAHNFRWHLLNNIPVSNCTFTSKTDSSSGDGTPDNPHKTIVTNPEGKPYLVIGAGDYLFNGQSNNTQLRADGFVQIRGANIILFKNYGGPAEPEAHDIRFVIGESLLCSGKDNNVKYLNRCFVKAQDSSVGALLATSEGSVPFAFDTVFKTLQSGVTNNKFRLDYCALIGCNLTLEYLKNSHADAACLLTVAQPEQCSNSNIQGAVIVAGVTYSSVADAQAANPGWFPGCFSANPRYNKPESEDFTLRRESPHLNAGVGPRHLRLATGFVLETTASPGESITVQNTLIRSLANPNYTIALLQTYGFVANDQGGLSIKSNSSGDAEGFLLTEKIRVGDTFVELASFNLIAGFNFDSDFAPDTANPNPYNNNVPDYTKPTPGTATASPNRLTQQMRWSRGTLPDVNTAGDWQSGSSFVEFEIGAAPRYNTAPLRGNGDAAYDVQAANEAVVARWVQLRVKTRNNF